MSGSPLTKNYIHQIRNIKPLVNDYIKQQGVSTKKVAKMKQQPLVEIFNDCVRTKITSPQEKNQYFEMILFDSGIFSINLVQISKILPHEKKNLSKSSITKGQRLLKSLYLFPTQTIVQCQYNLQSRFHKQMIIYCPGEYLIVNNFVNGRLDKQQYNFNLNDSILVKTIYQNDRLVKVNDYFFGDDSISYQMDQQNTSIIKIKLQKYFKDKNLCQAIYQLTEAKFDWLQPISITDGNTNYFGQLQTSQDLPSGIGLLVNHKITKKKSKAVSQKTNDVNWQFYFGMFESGLLNGVGQIWFQDKSSYFGQFQYGNAIGLGQFYSRQGGNRKKEQLSCFWYKDDEKFINQSNFIRWLRQSYFNGQTSMKNERNMNFIQNQYQKLKKIYAIPKKKELSYQFQNVKKTQRRSSVVQNSSQVDDFIDEKDVNKLKVSKDAFQSGDQDITFNKNDEIKDIFEKIKVKNINSSNGPKSSTKKMNLQRMSTTKKVQENLIKNTSRSDDHTYNVFSSKRKEQIESKPKKRRNNTNIYEFPNDSHYEDESANFQFGNIDENQIVDLGFEQVDESYFKNRQVNSEYKDMNDKDYIHKEYAFEEPKRMKTPDYFIVDYGKNHFKYDPTGLKSNLMPEEIAKKNKFSNPSPFGREKYLSPQRKQSNQASDKQNEQTIKRYEKTLTSTKNKRIFYNPASRQQT